MHLPEMGQMHPHIAEIGIVPTQGAMGEILEKVLWEYPEDNF